MIPRH
jgi:hypothetical protein